MIPGEEDILIAIFFWAFLAFLLGYAVSYWVHRNDLHNKLNPAGKFLINYADLDKDLLGIVLNKDLPEIEKSDYISLKVVVKEDAKSNPENSPGENS